MSSENKDETKGIKASFILEILGKPAKHLVESLEKIIKEIDEEKGVQVLKKKISEPKELEEKKGFYTTFAEVEIEVEKILYLAVLMFKYMPAHVEILEPELIVLSNNGWNDLLNELARRLHGYDEVARVLQMQTKQAQQRVKELEEEKKSN